MMRYRARWVFPGDGPPVASATISIADGRIEDLSDAQHGDALDLGDVALIPGLVNAHTHLEFSELTAPITPLRPFPDWIRQLIAWRRGRPLDWQPAIARGCREAGTSGTTLLGEIATSDGPCSEPLPTSPRQWVFREILGLSAETVGDRLNQAVNFLNREWPHADCEKGLSPHAPYSLHPELFSGLCQLASERQIPVAMHLAEFPEELQLLQHGTGRLVDLIREMGIWNVRERPRGRTLDFLKQLADLPRSLVIHGSLLDTDEIDFLTGQPRMSVVYCPRTHAAMGTGDHPWKTLISQGINVALGTDSRASNPDLNLFSECRFLHQQAPDLPASSLLALATHNGARALGETQRGTLRPGHLADLCCVRCPPGQIDAPERNLFHGEVVAVMSAGVWTTSAAEMQNP